MNSYQLFHEDGRPTGVWVCGECNRIATAAASYRQAAESCCQPPTCNQCGGPGRKHYLRCADCDTAAEAAKLAERIAQATKLDTWEGWVYWDGVGPNNGFFESVDAPNEWCGDEDGDAPPPEYVFVCQAKPLRQITAAEIIEWVTDDAFEDAADHVVGREELEAACVAFNTANAHVVSYVPDFTRMVRVRGVEP